MHKHCKLLATGRYPYKLLTRSDKQYDAAVLGAARVGLIMNTRYGSPSVLR